MPTILPFRALRYDPTRIPSLSAVTAPPYDVIDPDLHQRLLAEPCNIVHLDLNPAPLMAPDGETRYRRSARLLGEWRDKGVLRRDTSPALYVLEQEYAWAGRAYRRHAVIAACGLEPYGAIYRRHEETLSGPKEDRFQLMVETRCSFSQVLGIYPDPAGEVQSLFDATRRRQPDMEATDTAGDRHRVWIETDPGVIAAASAALAERPMTIADGHHRFETALRYRDWLAGRETVDEDHPAAYVAAALVGSGDPGLRLRATHRVIRGLPGCTAAALAEAAVDSFDWISADVDPRDAEAVETWLESAPLSAIGVLTHSDFGLLLPRDDKVAEAARPDASPRLRELNVTLLHHALLPWFIEPRWGAPTFEYVHRIDEVHTALAAGAQLAFVLRAVPIETMLAIAAGGEVMPPKTTYFYPKLLTGLVMYPLRG